MLINESEIYNTSHIVGTIAKNTPSYNDNVISSKTTRKSKTFSKFEPSKSKTNLDRHLFKSKNLITVFINQITTRTSNHNFDTIFLFFLAILLSLLHETSGSGLLISGRRQHSTSGFYPQKLERRKRSLARTSLEERLVLELYLANDLTRYQQYGEEAVSDVVRSSKEIANRVNLLFQPLGITVLLVGVEVWAGADKTIITEDIDLTFKNWMQYQSTYVTTPTDVAFLLTRVDFGYLKYGKVNVDSICSKSDSVGVLRVLDDRSEVTGSILAHYIGRVFNISVDVPDCECRDSKCIMNSQIPMILGPEKFSQCSIDQMNSSLVKGSEICLRNIPKVLDQYLSVCGNGILENNEECDCGRLPSHICNQKCCDEEKCTLKGQCAYGDCCEIESCTLKRTSHLCRPKTLEVCDIEEYCNGESSVCPVNTYVQDGTKCETNGKPGSCFGGQCTNRHEQCKLLYGDTAEDGSIECYNLNTQGTSDGHCGYDAAYDNYMPCSSVNVLCGSLKCNADLQNLSITRNIVSRSFRRMASINCFSVTFDYGTIQNNPGMVADGSPCGDDRVCKEGQCLSKDVLVTKKCPICDRGICSNDGTCICEKDFTGDQCDTWASIPKNQDGLIIGMFFLVLILALLTALIVYDCTHQNRLATLLNCRSKLPDETTIITNSPKFKPPQPPPANYKEIKENERKSNSQKKFRNKVMPSRPAPKPPKNNKLFNTPIDLTNNDNIKLSKNAFSNGGFNHQGEFNQKMTSNAQPEFSRNKDYNGLSTQNNYRNPFNEALSNKKIAFKKPHKPRGVNDGVVLKFNELDDNNAFMRQKYKNNESVI